MYMKNEIKAVEYLITFLIYYLFLLKIILADGSNRDEIIEP